MGADYNATRTQLSITGTGSVAAPVQIIDDSFPEGKEGFFGYLEAGTGASALSNIVLDPAIAFANIIENDGKEDHVT